MILKFRVGSPLSLLSRLPSSILLITTPISLSNSPSHIFFSLLHLVSKVKMHLFKMIFYLLVSHCSASKQQERASKVLHIN